MFCFTLFALSLSFDQDFTSIVFDQNKLTVKYQSKPDEVLNYNQISDPISIDSSMHNYPVMFSCSGATSFTKLPDFNIKVSDKVIIYFDKTWEGKEFTAEKSSNIVKEGTGKIIAKATAASYPKPFNFEGFEFVTSDIGKYCFVSSLETYNLCDDRDSYYPIPQTAITEKFDTQPDRICHLKVVGEGLKLGVDSFRKLSAYFTGVAPFTIEMKNRVYIWYMNFENMTVSFTGQNIQTNIYTLVARNSAITFADSTEVYISELLDVDVNGMKSILPFIKKMGGPFENSRRVLTLNDVNSISKIDVRPDGFNAVTTDNTTMQFKINIFAKLNFVINSAVDNAVILIDYHCPQNLAFSKCFNINSIGNNVTCQFTHNWFNKKQRYLSTYEKGNITGNVDITTEYNEHPYNFINCKWPSDKTTMNLLCLYYRIPEECPVEFQRISFENQSIDVFQYKQIDFPQMQIILLNSNKDVPIRFTLANVPKDYYINIYGKTYQYAIIEGINNDNKISLELDHIHAKMDSETHFNEFVVNDDVTLDCENGSVHADAINLNSGVLEAVIPKLADQESPMKVYDSFDIDFIGFCNDGYQLILDEGIAPFIPAAKFSTLKFVLTRALDKYDSLTLSFVGTKGEKVQKVADIESFAVRNVVVHFTETWKNCGVTFQRKSVFSMLLDLFVAGLSDYNGYPDNLFTLPEGSNIDLHYDGMYCLIPFHSSYICPSGYTPQEYFSNVTFPLDVLTCDEKGYDIVIAGAKENPITFNSTMFDSKIVRLTSHLDDEKSIVKIDAEHVPSSLTLTNIIMNFGKTTGTIKISLINLDSKSGFSGGAFDCDVLSIEQQSFDALQLFVDNAERSIITQNANIADIVIQNSNIIDKATGLLVKYSQYKTLLLSSYSEHVSISTNVDKANIGNVKVPSLEIYDNGIDPTLEIDSSFNPSWVKFNDLIQITVNPELSTIIINVHSTTFREDIFHAPENAMINVLPDGYYCLYQKDESASKCTVNYNPIKYTPGQEMTIEELKPYSKVLRVVVLDSNEQEMPIINLAGYGYSSISLRANSDVSRQYIGIIPPADSACLDWFYAREFSIKVLTQNNNKIQCSGLELYNAQFTSMQNLVLDVINQLKLNKPEEMLSTLPYLTKLSPSDKRDLRVSTSSSTIEILKDSFKLNMFFLDSTLFTTATIIVSHNFTITGKGTAAYTPSFEADSDITIEFDDSLYELTTQDPGQISNNDHTIILKSNKNKFPGCFEVPPKSDKVIYDLGTNDGGGDQSKSGGASAGFVAGMVFLALGIVAVIAVAGYFIYQRHIAAVKENYSENLFSYTDLKV